MAATLTSSGVNFSDGSTINGTAVNTIGSYSWLARFSGTGTLNIGSTVAGSSMRPAGTTMNSAVSWPVSISSGTLTGSGQNTSMAGTWRCMGYMFSGDAGCSGYGGATLFVRVS